MELPLPATAKTTSFRRDDVRPVNVGREAMNMNVARFDFVTIRLAVLCAELGSLSAASRRAHCSISAGSQRLKILEDSLGRTLFVRDHRGLQLTEAGEMFVGHANVILRELDLMVRNASDGMALAQ